jgi:hypothetical protein
MWSIRLQMLGLMFLGIALLAGLWAVARFVYGTSLAWWITLPTAMLALICWVVLPLSLRRRPPAP